MAVPDRQDSSKIRRSEQYIQNSGFDESYQVPVVLPVVENAALNGLVRMGENLFTKGKLVTSNFDYISATYPTSSSEVYTYKSGGPAGTTVATITVTYTDSTKNLLSSVART